MTKMQPENDNKGNEETFASTFKNESESNALKVFEKIRRNHSDLKCWLKQEGYIQELPDGKWSAVK